MANVALEKLSIAETLTQATKALQIHQKWMKERVSRIAPLDDGPFEVRATEREPKKKTAWEDSGERGPSAFVGVSISGGSGEETRQGTRRADDGRTAPPPFEMQARGGSERVLKRSRLAQVAPAPVRPLGSLTEDAAGLEKKGHKLQVAWGSTNDLQSPDRSNVGGHEKTEKRKGEDPIASEAATESKKRHLSEASVMPSETTDDVQQKTGPPGNPKAAGLFQSPPPVASFGVWGSLTSLDNYMESLQEFPRVETDAGGPCTDSGAKTVLREKLSTDSSIAVTRPVVQQPEPLTGQASKRSAPRNVSTPSDLESPKSSSHDNILDGSEAQEDTFGTTSDHIEVLQSTSSATIVAVSPAPRDQRSSYALHHQSKLTSSEAGLELLKVEPDATSGRESTALTSSVLSANKRESRPFKSHELPESILKPVLPARRQRRTGATVVSTLPPTVKTQVADSESKHQATGKSHHPGEGVQPILQTHSESMDRTLDITGHSSTHRLTAADNSEGSYATLASQHSLLSKEVSSTAMSSHQLAETRQDKSAPMATTEVHPANHSMVPSGDTRPLSSASYGAQRYEDLNLPPLKKQPGHSLYIDGSELIKLLPPLKLQSSSTTSLITELKLSRKRERDPPSYSIHCPPGKMVRAPPCPEHGIVQPLESEVLRNITRRMSQSDIPDFSTLFQSPSASQRTSAGSEPAGSRSTGRRGSQVAIGTPKPAGPRRRRYSDQSESGAKLLPPRRDSISSSQMAGPRQNNQPYNLQSDPTRQRLQEATSSSISSSSHQPGPAELQQDPSATTTDDLREPSISQMQTGPGPLHLAAKSGNLRRVVDLISQGHDVNMPDQDGQTPLMYCIHSRGVHLPCADALIKEAANLNKQASDGSTAIHRAAFSGAVSLIELLLRNGANPDVEDFDGRLALHWGTASSPKCIDILTKHSSVNLDATDEVGMTPLMWAAYNHNPAIIRYLLSHDADREEKDKDGYTAMHWAVHRDSTECLELLLQPDMTYFKDHKGCTVMHRAAQIGSMDACEVILKMRPDAIHDTDKRGRTPLHYAAACSRVDVCALILERGGDASQKDVEGNTALDYARKKRLDYVVALLTCHGTAVADFARASRSTSVSSLLNRAASFSQLPLQSPDVVSESLSPGPMPTILTASNETTLGGESEMSSSYITGQLLGGTDTRPVDTTKGAYLGRFTIDTIDPLQHFYFWLKPGAGTICWSRDSSKRYPKEAVVLELHQGPSNSVRQSPAYSPQDLHLFVFWVMTDSGVVDLMAYNEDAYVTWVNEIGRLAQRNESAGVSGCQSRPTSSRKRPPSEPETSAESDAVSATRTKTPPQTQGDLASAGKQQGSSRPPSGGGGGWTGNQYRLRSLQEQDHAPGSGRALSERAAVAELQHALKEPRSHLAKKPRPQPLTSTPYSSPHTKSIVAGRVRGNPPAVGSGFTPNGDPLFLYSNDVI